MPSAAASTTAGKKKAPKSAHKKGSKNDALARPLPISAALEDIVGKGPMGRTDITKKIWAYIKKNDLQVANDRRKIKPDAKLSKIIGSSPIDMMKLQTHLKKHINV